MITELVILSGKGGTGKTSITASFAALANNKVLADCDVDAADLHLILDPKIIHQEHFTGGKIAEIRTEDCVGCGKCLRVCSFDAVKRDDPPIANKPVTYHIDPVNCEGCGLCAYFCPARAVDFNPHVNGEFYISETRHGLMVHAKLGIAEENSGKLVTKIRKKAKELAETNHCEMIIIDGSPGIGCPVIASITDASMVLLVTEPTFSGLHDLERIAQVTARFGIPSVVCINKCDINPDITKKIKIMCADNGIDVLGEIRYDSAVTLAQIEGKSVVEYNDSAASQDIKSLWNRTSDFIEHKLQEKRKGLMRL